MVSNISIDSIRNKELQDRAVVEEYNLKTTDYRRRVEKRRSFLDIRTESMRTDDGKPKKGRLYDSLSASKNGGLRIDEMIYGLKMAHVSCTDDTDKRLVGSSPNSLMALERLVGGENPEATSRLKLSEILKDRFNLNLLCEIDESGFRKGRAIDTQGFIASNDDTIVLSYRFSTTLADWMANLSLTSSEWEPDKDEILGHAGVISSARGWWTKMCNPKKSKPRVHTAYYNNFIYTIPMIREHIIGPLLKDIESDDENVKPKKIYVCGCSLGAAISQIAFCFILDELYTHLKDPEYKRVDRLISVTAGCPRIGDRKFRKYVMEKMNEVKKLDRAVICRIVYNVDVVSHCPPNILNFHHLDKMVYITKGGKNFLINPDLSKKFTKFGELKTIYSTVFQAKKKDFDEKTHIVAEDLRKTMSSARDRFSVRSTTTRDVTAEPEAEQEEKNAPPAAEAAADAAEEEEKDLKTRFQEECDNAAEVVLDHMPYWYMFYLDKLKEEQDTMYKDGSLNTISEA